MGTKVQLKNHQLGIYSIKNLDEAHTAWLHYYEDEALSRPSDIFSRQRLSDGYSDQNKQLLRKTILQHEDTFRKQVNELHRLYRVQRNLMDETKKNWQSNYSLQEPAVLSGPFSSYRPLRDAGLPASTANCTNSFFCRDDKRQASLDALNDSCMLDCNRARNREQKNSELGRSPRFLIDLEFPAEAHSNNTIIDREAESFGRLREFPDLNGDPEPENLGKHPTGNIGCSTSLQSSKLELKSRNGTEFRSLVDLNQPIEEKCYGVARDLSLCTDTSSNSLHERTGCHHIPCKTKLAFSMEPDLFQIKDGEFNSESFSREKMLTPSIPEQLEGSHNSSWFFMNNQSNVEPWIKNKQLLCPEQHERRQASSMNSRLADHSASNSLLSQFAQSNMDSDSSWSKFVNRKGHIPNSFQTLTSLNGCAPSNAKVDSICLQGLELSHGKWKYSNHIASHQSSATAGSSPTKSFLRDIQSESRMQSHLQMLEPSYGKQYISNSSTKSQDLGIQEPFSSSGLMNIGNIPLNNSYDRRPSKTRCLEGNNGMLAGGLPWLKSNQACNDRVFRNWATEKDSGSVSGGINLNEERENKSLQGKTMEMKSYHPNPGGNSNDGFVLIDLNQSALTDFHQDYISADNLNSVIDTDSLATKNVFVQNSSLENKGMQLELAKPISTLSKKSAFTIDLEAPIVSHDKDKIVSEAFPSTSELRGGRPNDIERKSQQLCSETSRMGAEILLSFSSNSRMKHDDSSTSRIPGLASADTLSWFANIITCPTFTAENTESSNVVYQEKQDNVERLDRDGLDFFELMTLSLMESKLEDFQFHPAKHETEEGPGLASLLQPKLKRGQGRRRRQTRNFQKDILPGLATLSRYEVTEDLQTVGSLMRASGVEWHTGVGRQYAGKNGRNSRGRGRRVAQVLALEVEETAVDPASLQQSNNTSTGFENDGVNIIGWGRTRRCRRQRQPSGIIANPAQLT